MAALEKVKSNYIGNWPLPNIYVWMYVLGQENPICGGPQLQLYRIFSSCVIGLGLIVSIWPVPPSSLPP